MHFCNGSVVLAFIYKSNTLVTKKKDCYLHPNLNISTNFLENKIILFNKTEDDYFLVDNYPQEPVYIYFYVSVYSFPWSLYKNMELFWDFFVNLLSIFKKRNKILQKSYQKTAPSSRKQKTKKRKDPDTKILTNLLMIR